MKLLHLSCAVALILSSASGYAANQNHASISDVVVVTATTNETTLDKAPASVTVITNEELNKLPATNITTALESVAGVHISRSTGSEPKIVVRGMHNQNSSNGNYTLLLVNGRRVSSSETVIRGAGFDLSSIPMSAIDHIEVVRGPMSSIYGSEALGGVVNVILKTPTEETHIAGSLSYSMPDDHAASSVSPTSDGKLTNGKGFASGSIIDNQLLYTLSVDVSDQEGWYPNNAGDNFTPQAKQKRTGMNAGLTWLTSDQDTVTLDVGYLDDDRTEIDSSDTDYNSFYESKKLTTNLGHQRDWSWGESKVNYFYERSKVHENNSHPMVAEADLVQNNHTVDGKVAFSPAEQHMLTTGVAVSYTSVENERDYTGDRSVTESAVFAQDEYALLDDLTLTLSGRFTHNNQFGSNFSPRVYAVYQATSNLTFKGGYGEGFKAPTIFQSSDDFSLISCGGSCYLIGNPDLKAQTSKSYEFSAMYQQPSWYAQATGFFNQVDDMIDRDLDNRIGNAADGNYLIHYVNVDEVETQGVELELEFDISDDLYVTSNATFTQSENQSNHQDIAYTPKWLANATLNWLPTQEVSLFTSINYTGTQKDSDDNKLDDYQIINFGGRYQISNELALKMGITNLFDERLDDSDQDYEDTEIGRTYYVTLDFEI